MIEPLTRPAGGDERIPSFCNDPRCFGRILDSARERTRPARHFFTVRRSTCSGS